jgi:hypothetical protein
MPTGSPKTAAPAATPTSGSRFTKEPATSAETWAWPTANSVAGARVPSSTSPGGGQHGARAGGGGRDALGGGSDGEGGERRRQELHGGHGDRVAAGQQAGLGHGERGREPQRRQDQPVAGEGGAASPRLKESGVIRVITARLDPRSSRVFEDQVRALPQITAADNVAGEMDYLLTIVARDVAELQQVLARLATRGGQRLVTYLRLEEIKPPSPLPLTPTPPPPSRTRRAR